MERIRQKIGKIKEHLAFIRSVKEESSENLMILMSLSCRSKNHWAYEQLKDCIMTFKRNMCQE